MNPQKAQEKLGALQAQIESIIRGKTDVVRGSIVGILAHGHVLFEDLPGVGKTTLAHALAVSLGLTFTRMQFTSDLLPSDILGVTIYDQAKGEFHFRPGPVFANVVLIDEINRTTPKTQSALLQAMNTANVSIERETYPLPQPFMVIATQNPLDTQGTFPLPQGQLDRFLLRLHMGYPDPEDEKRILRDSRAANDFSMIGPVLNKEDLEAMQAAVERVKVDDTILDYVVRLAQASRRSQQIEVGISTRAALALQKASRAQAYMEGREYVIPEDVKRMAVPVLAHRIRPVTAFESGAPEVGRGTELIEALLDEVDVPV